jgi:hypothetical protein
MGTHLSTAQNLKSQTLRVIRTSTKRAILKNRTLLGIPLCPICDKPLTDAGDLHEVFITRGDVQSNRSEIQELIHVPMNCAIVHPDICHIVAQHSEAGKWDCAKQIVKFEGYANVKAWLLDMQMAMRGRVPGDEIKWLSEHENTLCQTTLMKI